MNYEVQGEAFTEDDEPYRLNIPYNPQAGTSEYVGEGIEFELQGDSLLITDGYVRLYDSEAYHVTPDRATGVPLPELDGMNYVYIQYDSSADSTWVTPIQYHIDTDDTPPTVPSLRIAKVDTSTGTITQLNRTSGATFSDLITGRINNIEQISGQADLPEPTNGTITLETATGYKPNGFVFVDTPFHLQDGQPAPFLGSSGGLDGFVYTGGGTMIQGSGPLFMDDIYMHAPGGTLFGVAADSETEMYIKDTSFSDAVNQGDMASLGVIDGYRVQTFKGVNFENFQEGITLTGPTSKSFFEGCPIRNITSSGVTIIQTDTDYQGELLKVSTDCYIKNVQSDTEVVRVPAGGEPSNYFKYYNVDHPDGTVTKDNILNGEIGVDQTGTIVRNCYPLADSAVVGEMHNDNPSETVTISTADTWYDLTIPSTLDTAERLIKAADGKMEHTGTRDKRVQGALNLSFYGANGDVYQFAIAHNGHVHTPHTSSIEARGTQSNVTITVNSVEVLVNGDTLGLQVKNQDNANDLTVLSYSFSAVGV